MAPKPAYHHGNLREALLDAGDAVLLERGLAGFTLRACARRAGVSHAAPKYHFGDVTGLLSAIAARGFERLHRRLRDSIDDVRGNLDAEFLATGQAYTEFAERYPEHFRIMFRADLLQATAELVEAAERTYTELTNVILRQRGEAEISPQTLSQATSMEAVLEDILIGWCWVHGYAHLRLEAQLEMVPECMHERLARNAATRLSGLIRQAAPRRR